MDGSRLRFLSFWAINDGLDLQALKDQLDEMKEAGLDGVVFHPRYYPNEPVYMSAAYLQIVSQLILHAKSIGMTFWLYDENGWPSGTAGGQVLARCPELTVEWVEYATLGGEDGEERAVIRSKKGVSSLDPRATAQFIDITHEGYRKGLVPEAFEYVTGFFTDEVAFLDGRSVTVERGAVPWCAAMPERYRLRCGEELVPLLPHLFEESAGSRLVRTRYWELLTDVLLDSYYRPIAEWCAKQGKLFTGHLKGEEDPFFQLCHSGSCFHLLKELTLPAIDALERNPGNDFYPRIVHSLSVQQGRDSCLAEAHGGSGWGTSPESFSRYILWLAGHGIEQFVLHIGQFRLSSQAVHDWPPSMPLHMTWREAFPAVLADIRGRASALPNLRGSEPELLIVTPTRGVMAGFDPRDAMAINDHNGDNAPDSTSGRTSKAFIELVQECHAAGIHYELTEERTLEEIGVMEAGSVVVGERAYRRVLVADGCAWSSDEACRTAPDRLADAGVKVLTPQTWRGELAVTTFKQEKGRSQAVMPGQSVLLADKLEHTEWRSEKPKHTERPVLLPEQTGWRALQPERNQLALSFENVNGRLRTEVAIETEGSIGDVALICHDELRSVAVNGHELSQVERLSYGRLAYKVDRGRYAGGGMLTIELLPYEGSEPYPVVFLEGAFLVVSMTPYENKDDRQLQTAGPFRVSALTELDASDLIASGMPFSASPMELHKKVRLDENVTDVRLELTGVRADAAQVWIDGVSCGWCWGPDWTVLVAGELAAGWHEVAVRLVPSTFNGFGPHHHYEGDRYLTSPGQYRGEKNFADSPDAPAFTLVDEWHFVKWGLQGDIRLLV